MSSLDGVLNHHTIDQLNMAESYLKDLLPESQRLQFSAHLQDCDECMDRIRLAQMWLLVIPTEATEASPESVPISNDPVAQGPEVAADLGLFHGAMPVPEAPAAPVSADAPNAMHAEADIFADELPASGEPHQKFTHTLREPPREPPREPMVTRVNVQYAKGQSAPTSAPEGAATDFGEMLAKRMAAEGTVTTVNATETASPVRVVKPVIRSRFPQFATWQLVVLGLLMALLLMAIPTAYFLMQIRRMTSGQ